MNNLMSKLALVALLTASVGMTMAVVDGQEAAAQSKKKGRVIKKGGKSKPQVGVRAGYTLSGAGKGEAEVGGTTVTGKETDEVASPGFNAFGLFPIAKGMHVGASVWYFSGVSHETEDGKEPDKQGTQLDLNGMFQYTHKLNKQLGGFGYIEGGYTTWTPAKDEGATTDPDAMTGLNYGGGVGASFKVSKQLLLRGDLSYRIYNVEGDRDFGGASGTVKFEANRAMINIGGAFML